jgi:ribosomal protein S18 acetylase RimI-like enzyme
MKPFPHESDGIRYSVCEERDLPEMNRLLAETFTREDPPAVAVGLSVEEFEAFVRLVSASAVADGLTIVARDIASGLMAGALLTEDAASPPPHGMDRLSVKTAPIFGLLSQLDARLQDEMSTTLGEVLYLFVLGVEKAFARRGIRHQLVVSCLANGAERGYSMAVTEATNRVSQHIFAKQGFRSRAEVSYADYRHDGVAVFASIAEHGGPMSMGYDIPTPD